ncbi:ABC transporter ATP-binding protein [Mahella sp.]|uniref:ABC transporter ATP-binding protein n=1 Tax=Mahella sp. TaxID=2798721 RepID=UPI0025C0B436|nr:ABC transporter ATP-binding protein [Mahella sp.]MBZ4665399.1 transporter related protein [Mahella sp.]MDK2902671.1 linearmycin/streptolysin transport system ATP-binding protein [Clostridiales bacterium]
MFLQTKDLVKSFGDKVVVDHVNLEVKEGEVFGLLGPNGAGKTTTISMICGLLKPDGGDILFEGKSAVKDSMFLKRVMGVVPQDIALYPMLTANENLYFWGRMYGLSGRELDQRVKEVLDIMGLSDRAKERIDKYSGGMKRRINIAAALMHRPRLLIMDEPTVGIDPQSRNHILESVKQFNQQGMTIIYTSHYMEEVEYLCHRVAIMDYGKVIALGTKDELKAMVGDADKVIMETGLIFDDIKQRLSAFDYVENIMVTDNTVDILVHDAKTHLPDLISAVIGAGGDIASIKVEEPNLEGVFLHLTGRQLRD